MDTDRRARAKSIRAARDWLTGAENALVGEDDLAGDLKLMLASAELARLAADRRTRLRRSALRLLPPLAAAAFIAGYFLWEQPPPAKTAVPSPVQRARGSTRSTCAGVGVVHRAGGCDSAADRDAWADGRAGRTRAADAGGSPTVGACAARCAPAYAKRRYAASHAGRRQDFTRIASGSPVYGRRIAIERAVWCADVGGFAFEQQEISESHTRRCPGRGGVYPRPAARLCRREEHCRRNDICQCGDGRSRAE